MRPIDDFDPNVKQELGEATYIVFLYDETKLYVSSWNTGVYICGLENMRKLKEFMNSLDIEDYE